MTKTWIGSALGASVWGLLLLIPTGALAKDNAPWTKGEGAPSVSDKQRQSILADSATQAKAGYLNRPDTTAPQYVMLDRIRQEEATLASARNTQRVFRRQFFPLSATLEKRSSIGIKSAPSALVGSGSNYIALSNGRVTRLYPETPLGAVMVRDVAGAQVRFIGNRAPDIVIGKTSVYVATVRYANSRWATDALADSGARLVHVTFGTRLDSPEKERQARAWLEAMLMP